MITDSLISDIKGLLSEKRFNHSVGVMRLAESLAAHYGIDSEKAALAGILHDCAKEFDSEKMRRYFDMGNVTDRLITTSPKLWHGIAGAYYAKEKYGIDDEIFDAIYYHTLSRMNMPMLTKIIYLSDNIEETRDAKLPWARGIREKAYTDIDGALVDTINHTLKYIIEKGYTMHPNAIMVRNEILLNREQTGDNNE